MNVNVNVNDSSNNNKNATGAVSDNVARTTFLWTHIEKAFGECFKKIINDNDNDDNGAQGKGLHALIKF